MSWYRALATQLLLDAIGRSNAKRASVTHEPFANQVHPPGVQETVDRFDACESRSAAPARRIGYPVNCGARPAPTIDTRARARTPRALRAAAVAVLVTRDGARAPARAVNTRVLLRPG